eukprot:TRINITY_DN3112_c0_g1_i1.p1 TRINITY_DN3112_c0_g1~~TRINITY_DN3112_c0_g1_i1.p1  ORF type:complete len:538 (+),score=87.11 TRINITY_DN3112_c0_g1_i1:91-1704(+)
MNFIKTVLFPENRTVHVSKAYAKERRLANNTYHLLDDAAQVFLNRAASEKRGQLRRQHKKNFPIPFKEIMSTISLKDILRDYCSLFRVFYDFAKKTHTEENIDFIIETANWKKSYMNQDFKRNFESARAIYVKYVGPGAACSINIDHDISAELDAAIPTEKISADMWSGAQLSCLKILETDSVSKFLSDTLFFDWRERELRRRERLLEKNEYPPWVAFTRAIKEGQGVDYLKGLIAQGATACDEEEETLFSALHLAVKRTDKEMGSVVRFLLSQEASINAPDCQGWTPFHVACESGNLDACDLLIATGKANLTAPTGNRNFPHNLLVINNYNKSQMGQLQEILHAIHVSYPKENCFNLRNLKGETCLHYLVRNSHECSVQIGSILLELGASPNIRNRRGYTPLHTAILQERSDLVNCLILSGADTTLKCRLKSGEERSVSEMLAQYPSLNSLVPLVSGVKYNRRSVRLSFMMSNIHLSNSESSTSEELTSPMDDSISDLTNVTHLSFYSTSPPSPTTPNPSEAKFICEPKGLLIKQS